MTEPRTVLVTGAGGFIGARIAAALEDRGLRVRRWAHRAPDLRDAEARATMVAGAQAVVHSAAELDPAASETDVDAINHIATRDLALEAARAGARHFVFLSSQAAIGWQAAAGVLKESTPCSPSTAYGRSKLAAERALATAELGECTWTALRPPTVYGAEERRNFLLLARAATCGVHPLPGGGHNRMSFCHVENLVDAVLHVLDVGLGGVVHVADARPVTFRETLRRIARAAGRPAVPIPLPISWLGSAARHLETLAQRLGRPAPLSPARLATVTADCALSIERLRASGWRPPVGFDEGLEETLAAYRAAGLLVMSRAR